MRMEKYSKLIISLIFFIIFGSLYSFNLFSSYNFDNDFARDLIEINKIINGNLTFIGPAASIGIQTGPYYYYLFAPVGLITKVDINLILFFNALLFALSIGFLEYYSSKVYGNIKAVLISCSIALLPVTIISARNPGNAFSYIPMLIILLTLLIAKNINHKFMLILLGILSGLILNFHYSNGIILISIFLFIILYLKKKRAILYYLISLIITFLPLILFEIKNNFIMMKTLFLNQSYKNFTNNTQLAGSESAKKNIFENAIFISGKAVNYISIHPIFLIISGIIFSYKKIKSKEAVLFMCSIISFILLILFLRSQYAYFYLFPAIIFLVFSTVLLFAKSKYYFPISILIIFEIIFFPVNTYNPSQRHFSGFENAVNFVIKKNIIKSPNFNILQVRPDTIIAPYGNEYRFFFIKKGYSPLTVTGYNNSEQLIVFSEIPNFDLENLKNTESSAFGNKYKVKKYNYKNITIYSLLK